MAQRIATEYENAVILMTEFQMTQYLRKGGAGRITTRIKVLGGGEQELVLTDSCGEEVHVAIERQGMLYRCSLNCRIVSPHLNNAVRKLFVTYKGTGTVNRIYRGFTMKYDYEKGSVRRISEWTPGGSKLVYEHKQTPAELTALYRQNTVELEIKRTRREVDTLLDLRNVAEDAAEREVIDERLKSLAQRLFQLEG